MTRLILLIFLLVASAIGSRASEDDMQALLARARAAANARKYDSAVILADLAIKKATSPQDRKATINAMRLKGKALFGLKKEKEAIDLYFGSLAKCKIPDDDKERAWTYGEIGYAYFIQGHHQESKSYYRKEIAILSHLLGRDSVGNQFINMSVMHQQLGEFDSALLALNEVNDILSRWPDSSLKGYYLFNMGAYWTAMNQPDKARECYLQAYNIWKALNNQAQLFKITFNLGFYYYQKKNYNEALKYYHQSVAAAEKFGNKRDIAHVYGTMAESYAALNQHNKAYEYLYRYATLSDSFNQEDVKSYVLKLDKQFQAEQNRQTIQSQQIQINAANLAIQKHRNTTLIIIIIFVVVLSAGIFAFGYLTFKNRVAKQVEEAKGRFFANVAHEIRTPLSMIRGPLEVLQQNATDTEMQQQIAIATRNTQRLNNLIDQMLDISKIDAARYTLHPSTGNIEDLTIQLFDQFRRQAVEHNIKLSCTTDCTAGQLLFDRDALEKIMSNLVGNAIKYTPTGGSAGVEVTTSRNSDGYAMLSINVWDTGAGIPVSEREHIFDRFYRSEHHKRAGIKGIGIGLSLTRELVALMNGTISVSGDEGKGAVFTVHCPLPITPSNSATDSSGNAGVILLVEDDTDILAFNKRLLTAEGFDVKTATDGNEASSLLASTLPDLVITDLMMPHKSGNELLQEIRRNELTAHIPVIILSARGSMDTKTETLASGAQAFLSKPFSPAELKALVRNQLDILNRRKIEFREHTTDTDKPVEKRFTAEDPFTRKCCEIINEHLDDAQLSVEMLAGLMNINRSHFQRKIKTLTGYSPSELIKTIRLEKAREMLLKKEGNITEIAYATGFTSQSYFTKCYTDHFGHPPSQTFEHA